MIQPVREPVVTPWRPVEAIPLGLAAVAATLLVWVVLTAGGGFSTTDVQIVGLVQQAFFLGLSVAWVGIRHGQGLGALGLRSTRPAKDLALGGWFGVGLFGIAVLVVLRLIVVLWRLLSGSPPDPIEQPILSEDPSTLQIVLGAFVAVVAAPIGEEVFFRGFLFGSLRGRFGFIRSAAISAVAFAILHGDPVLILVMVFVGIALAWIYERRGSLLAPIGAHAMFNVIGYTALLVYRT
jgi:membrane protease YdiL (CAAX protease family)